MWMAPTPLGRCLGPVCGPALIVKLPERARRQRPHLGTERQSGVAGIEDEACQEVVAYFGGEMSEAVEVFGSHRRSGLDLDTDHLTPTIFDHHIDFHLVVVAIV